MIATDSLKSFLSTMAGAIGLGSGRDKSAALGFAHNAISPAELIAMYRGDWLSRKIVDIIPNDMTREWRDWQAGKDQISAIEDVEKSPLVDVARKTNRALRRARLMGGAVIFIGIRNADHSEPLDLDRIGRGDLAYLHVLGRTEVSIGNPIRDVLDPLYGEPEWYEVTGASGQVRVHPSRMVRFTGMEIVEETLSNGERWGDSVLQIVYDAVRNATSSQSHIASLIPELKNDIIYVPGLSKHMATPAGEQALTKRFSYAMQMKSLYSLTLLEGNGGTGDGAQGEKWEQKQISFSQLPELMRQYLQIACGAADITSIRLLGEAPSGLGSNGESALISYYDGIGARQRTELSPQMHRLDEVIIRSALGERDPDIYYEWASLWGLSDKDKADVALKKAQAFKIDHDSGLFEDNVLAKARANQAIEDGLYPGLEAAMEDAPAIDFEEDPAASTETEPSRNDLAPSENEVPPGRA